MIALCRHLLLQGYTGNEITILATYSGQMQYMIRVNSFIFCFMFSIYELYAHTLKHITNQR